jgi:hypothetical protein
MPGAKEDDMAQNPDRGLTPVRLAEIEQSAIDWRQQAEVGRVSLGFDSTDIFALAIAVAGKTQACPNLAHEGHRLAGQLDCRGAIPIVRYEAYDPLPRQRFSVAHELGHLFLHERVENGAAFNCGQEGVASDEDTGSLPTDEESEADAFAAAFLMPRASLEQDVTHFGVSAAFLAERYGVSRRAMERRLASLHATCP